MGRRGRRFAVALEGRVIARSRHAQFPTSESGPEAIGRKINWRNIFMRKHFQFFPSFLLLVATASIFPPAIFAQQPAQKIPKAIQAPDNERLYLLVHAS